MQSKYLFYFSIKFLSYSPKGGIEVLACQDLEAGLVKSSFAGLTKRKKPKKSLYHSTRAISEDLIDSFSLSQKKPLYKDKQKASSQKFNSFLQFLLYQDISQSKIKNNTQSLQKRMGHSPIPHYSDIDSQKKFTDPFFSTKIKTVNQNSKSISNEFLSTFNAFSSKKKINSNFFPYRKSFICYWLLPVMGFFSYISSSSYKNVEENFFFYLTPNGQAYLNNSKGSSTYNMFNTYKDGDTIKSLSEKSNNWTVCFKHENMSYSPFGRIEVLAGQDLESWLGLDQHADLTKRKKVYSFSELFPSTEEEKNNSFLFSSLSTGFNDFWYKTSFICNSFPEEISYKIFALDWNTSKRKSILCLYPEKFYNGGYIPNGNTGAKPQPQLNLKENKEEKTNYMDSLPLTLSNLMWQNIKEKPKKMSTSNLKYAFGKSWKLLSTNNDNKEYLLGVNSTNTLANLNKFLTVTKNSKKHSDTFWSLHLKRGKKDKKNPLLSYKKASFIIDNCLKTWVELPRLKPSILPVGQNSPIQVLAHQDFYSPFGGIAPQKVLFNKDASTFFTSLYKKESSYFFFPPYLNKAFNNIQYFSLFSSSRSTPKIKKNLVLTKLPFHIKYKQKVNKHSFLEEIILFLGNRLAFERSWLGLAQQSWTDQAQKRESSNQTTLNEQNLLNSYQLSSNLSHLALLNSNKDSRLFNNINNININDLKKDHIKKITSNEFNLIILNALNTSKSFIYSQSNFFGAAQQENKALTKSKNIIIKKNIVTLNHPLMFSNSPGDILKGIPSELTSSLPHVNTTEKITRKNSLSRNEFIYSPQGREVLAFQDVVLSNSTSVNHFKNNNLRYLTQEKQHINPLKINGFVFQRGMHQNFGSIFQKSALFYSPFGGIEVLARQDLDDTKRVKEIEKNIINRTGGSPKGDTFPPAPHKYINFLSFKVQKISQFYPLNRREKFERVPCINTRGGATGALTHQDPREYKNRKNRIEQIFRSYLSNKRRKSNKELKTSTGQKQRPMSFVKNLWGFAPPIKKTSIVLWKRKTSSIKSLGIKKSFFSILPYGQNLSLKLKAWNLKKNKNKVLSSPSNSYTISSLFKNRAFILKNSFSTLKLKQKHKPFILSLGEYSLLGQNNTLVEKQEKDFSCAWSDQRADLAQASWPSLGMPRLRFPQRGNGSYYLPSLLEGVYSQGGMHGKIANPALGFFLFGDAPKNERNANFEKTNIFNKPYFEKLEKRKYAQKKYRRKKQRKENRRRKKRKRFYPRPSWSRNKIFQTISYKLFPQRGNRSLGKPRLGFKVKREEIGSQKLSHSTNLTPTKAKSIWVKKNVVENLPIYSTKDLYQIKRSVLGEFKRAFWKSYWLRSNLKPYLNRIKIYLKEIEKSYTKETLDFYLQNLFLVLSGLTNSNIGKGYEFSESIWGSVLPTLNSGCIPQRGMQQHHKIDSTKVDSNFYTNLHFLTKHPLSNINGVVAPSSLGALPLDSIPPEGEWESHPKKGFSIYSTQQLNLISTRNPLLNESLLLENNQKSGSNLQKWQLMTQISEHNRIMYERIQNLIFNIRENLTLNGQFKARPYKSSGHQKFKSLSSLPQNNTNTAQSNPDFWSKLGKTATYLTQSSTKYYGDFSNYRLYWAIHKSRLGSFKTINKLKSIWMNTKNREQSKANKTKKILYEIKKKLSSLSYSPQQKYYERSWLGLDQTQRVSSASIFEETQNKDSNLSLGAPRLLFPQRGNKSSLIEIAKRGLDLPHSLQMTERKLKQKEQKLNFLGLSKDWGQAPSFLNDFYKVGQKKQGLESENVLSNKIVSNFDKNISPIDQLTFYNTFSSADSNVVIYPSQIKEFTNEISYWWSAPLKFIPFFSNDFSLFCAWSDQQADLAQASLRSSSNSLLSTVNFTLAQPHKITTLGAVTFLFHFCALISLISVSQVRDFTKFLLIVTVKISKIYLHLIYSSLNSFVHFSKNLWIPYSPGGRIETLHAPPKGGRIQGLGGNTLSSLYPTQNFSGFKELSPSTTSPFSNRNDFWYFEKKPERVKILGSYVFSPKGYTKAFEREHSYKEAKVNKKTYTLTRTELLQSKSLYYLLVSFSKILVQNSPNYSPLGNKSAAEPHLESLSKTYVSNQTRKSISSSKKLQTLYTIVLYSSLNALVFSLSNFSNITYTYFLRSLNVIESSVRSIYTFLEKPGELIIDWMAYFFLVEWASDLTNTIPDTVDSTLNNSLTKLSRLSRFPVIPTTFLSAELGNIAFVGNTLSNYNLGALSLVSSSWIWTFSVLSGGLIQRRILSMYDIFVNIACRPDTDLIIRQRKGSVFWDLWSDLLIGVAEDSNINVSELSNSEEQNRLLEKLITSEKIKSDLENSNGHSKKDFNPFSFISLKRKNEKIKKKTKKDTSLLSLYYCPNPKKYQHSSLKGGIPEQSRFLLERINFISLKKQNISKPLSWSTSQFLSYQGKDTELFIDLHPPKSFSQLTSMKYSESINQPIGLVLCQIFSGLFYKQIAKNLLVVGPQGNEKSMLIQAIAGETEFKIITDNAYRYAMVFRGVAVGIKLLRDVFHALAHYTPCIFLLEDIHAIGERRPFLISDDENTSSTESSIYPERDEIHEKNQVVYQLTKHIISHYKKPYKGDFSLLIPTNHFCFDLFNSTATVQKRNKITLTPSSMLTSTPVWDNKPLLTANEKETNPKILSSSLQLPKNQLLAPPATSPFSVLVLKEEKKLKPKKLVKEFPWAGLPGEQYANISKATYSIRVKVALLADMVLSNLSVKLDMITDLLVIIDSVKGNRGFVVFATTHVPYVLDPALRRPGRFDETLSLPQIPNLLSRWHISKAFISLWQYQNSSLKKSPASSLNYSEPFSIYPLGISCSLWQTNHSSFLQPSNNYYSLNHGPITLLDSNSWWGAAPVKKSLKPNRNELFPQRGYISFGIPRLEKLAWSRLPHNTLTHIPYCRTKLSIPPLKSKNSVKQTWSFVNQISLQKRTILTLRVYTIVSKIFISLQQCTKVHNTTTQNWGDFAFSLIKASPNSVFGTTLNRALSNDSLIYTSLYSSPHIFKQHLTILMAGQIGSSIAKGNLLNTSNSFNKNLELQLGGYSSPLFSQSGCGPKGDTPYLTKALFLMQKNQKIDGMLTQLAPLINLTNFDQTWRTGTSLVFSFIQKRWIYGASSAKKNLIVPRLLDFGLEGQKIDIPSPPSSNILLPAKRYENYKRTFNYSLLKRKTNISLNDQIQLHQQQRLVKRLYKIPLKEYFRSEILTSFNLLNINNNNKLYENIETVTNIPSKNQSNNNFTSFSNASIILSPLENIQQKPTSMNWYFRHRLLNRHHTYLANQWWNGQLQEHNTESTFLSDIDWRYAISSTKDGNLGDLFIDFPDAEQYYNPKSQRWINTSGSWNSWFDFQKTAYHHYSSHYIFECLTNAYKSLDQNRELLDYYVINVLEKGQGGALPQGKELDYSPLGGIEALASQDLELDILELFKRFYK